MACSRNAIAFGCDDVKKLSNPCITNDAGLSPGSVITHKQHAVRKEATHHTLAARRDETHGRAMKSQKLGIDWNRHLTTTHQEWLQHRA